MTYKYIPHMLYGRLIQAILVWEDVMWAALGVNLLPSFVTREKAALRIIFEGIFYLVTTSVTTMSL